MDGVSEQPEQDDRADDGAEPTLRDHLLREDLELQHALPDGAARKLAELASMASKNEAIYRNLTSIAVQNAQLWSKRGATAESMTRLATAAAEALAPTIDRINAVLAPHQNAISAQMLERFDTIDARIQGAAASAMLELSGDQTRFAGAARAILELSAGAAAPASVDDQGDDQPPLQVTGEPNSWLGPRALSVKELLGVYVALWAMIQVHVSRDGDKNLGEAYLLTTSIVCLLWAISNMLP